ncbi:MAG: hypothetical protein K6A43_07460 [Treponema sp.]|nr:hypothetical protein [Treponema sp.]
MKRGVSFFILFFLTSVLFAKIPEINLKELFKDPAQSTEAMLSLNTMEGFSSAHWIFSSVYNFQTSDFFACAGIEGKYGKFQLTMDALYWFFNHPSLKLGANFNYNFALFAKYSTCNNFLPGVVLEWVPEKWLTIDFNAAYFLKLRNIFAMSDTHPVFYNNSVAFILRSTFSLPKNFTLSMQFASIEPFHYMLFCAPSFTLGIMYSTKQNYDIFVNATVRYIDFFTNSSHYEESQYTLGVRYKW